jgi:AmmeMemoRadiSam system protein B
VAGTFYPADRQVLRDTVLELLDQARTPDLQGHLRGLIVPHAGLVYSGPVAATAYSLLEGRVFDRIVLVGPSHFERFDGIAALDASQWRTPLGAVPLARVPRISGVFPMRDAYRREHCLEVQIPFLQVAMEVPPMTPLLVGHSGAAAVMEVLDVLTVDATLLLVSTDLSHYEEYGVARSLDRATTKAVVSGEIDGLPWSAACGLTGLQAAVGLAKSRGWEIQLLDLRNSGDTAGPRDQVVGYGAFAIVQPIRPP